MAGSRKGRGRSKKAGKNGEAERPRFTPHGNDVNVSSFQIEYRNYRALCINSESPQKRTVLSPALETNDKNDWLADNSADETIEGKSAGGLDADIQVNSTP